MQTSTTLPTLRVLYRDHFRSVAAFISRKYPMLDSEDVTQLAYVKFWQRFPDADCKGREPFRVLLYLARLCAVNAIRKATRYKRCEHLRIDGDIEAAATTCGPMATIHDALPSDLIPFALELMGGESCHSLYPKYGQQPVRRMAERIRECLSN